MGLLKCSFHERHGFLYYTEILKDQEDYFTYNLGDAALPRWEWHPPSRVKRMVQTPSHRQETFFYFRQGKLQED